MAEFNIFTVGGMLAAPMVSILEKPSNTLFDYFSELGVVDGKGEVRILNGDLP